MSSAIATQELRHRVTACKRITIVNSAGSVRRWRGSSTLSLGLLAVAWLASCALKPVENPPAASHDDCAAPNPLHMVSTSTPKREVDPEIESLLAQRSGDPRLTQINRQMYQSLHALDAEIRREQKIAACKRPALNDSTLEAQSSAGHNPPPNVGSAMGPSPSPEAGFAARAVSAPSAGITPRPTSEASLSAAAGVTGSGGGQVRSLRKPKSSVNGAGGNGATAPKIVPGSDDDVVARRLRKAAEAETDPVVRAKLWKEYTDYRQGTAVAK